MKTEPNERDIYLDISFKTMHDSWEGVRELKTNEAYHSKADGLVLPEMFESLWGSIFENLSIIKFATFSTLFALTAMVWEVLGQIACQMLSYSLLISQLLGKFVKKSCIARFFDDDACDPSALSCRGPGHSSSLAHANKFWANACSRSGLVSRFISISGQTAHCSLKIQERCYRAPYHSLCMTMKGALLFPCRI